MIWTLSKLTNILTENGVDLTKWGKGEAKTIHHLLKELIKEECEIIIREGKVVRIVHALSITVIYRNEVLKEKYQIFKDGRKRRRRMDCSVAEKLHPSEISDLNSAVKRGLKEELQINDISTSQIREFPQVHRTRASGSYPDTSMDMVLYKFNVQLKEHQYNPDGYIENQEDKDTYFVWIKQENLIGSGWVNENKGSDEHNLENCTKILDELETITPILTDVGIKICCEIHYQWDSGFYILVDLYKYDKIYRWCRSTEIYKLEEYEEFSNRLIDIVKEVNNYAIDLDQKYKNGPFFLIMMEECFDTILNIESSTAYRKKVFNPS